jgi:hypothetical protein
MKVVPNAHQMEFIVINVKKDLFNIIQNAVKNVNPLQIATYVMQMKQNVLNAKVIVFLMENIVIVRKDMLYYLFFFF